MSKGGLTLAGLVALLALGVAIGIPFWILPKVSTMVPSVEVALLALAGLLGTFACVALLVLVFKAMDLANPGQALGMPEGSVRALLALLLVASLGMAGLFLLGAAQPAATDNKNNSNQNPAHGSESGDATAPGKPVANTGARTLANSVGDYRLAANSAAAQALTSPQPGAADAGGRANNAAGTAHEKNDLVPSSTNTPTSTSTTQDGDLVKQFLTLLGTLVTTIVGFYFGSQTATSAATKALNQAGVNKASNVIPAAN